MRDEALKVTGTAEPKMRIGQWQQLVKLAILISTFVECLVQPARAQSVHREKVQIIAGPTVQVSKASPDVPHYENLAAGDPAHNGRLIACAMAFPDHAVWCGTNCYVSFDGGKTWDSTLKVTGDGVNGDPTVAYGSGESVYVVTIRGATSPKPANTIVFKSPDGGRTWGEASRFRWTDRPYVIVDRTDGKYAGRIYVLSEYFVQEMVGTPGSSGWSPAWTLQMWRSIDDGKTFLGPVQVVFPEGTRSFGLGTAVLLSNGTVAVLFGRTKKGRGLDLEQEPTLGPNAEFNVIMSKDGGETFTQPYKIADVRLDLQRTPGTWPNGQLTVDPGSQVFHDRLYAVFPALVSGRYQIQSSYSEDESKTWSKPLTVNDDRSPEQGGAGPDQMLPAAGVNKDGVLLVTWYDRRDAKSNLGWRMRAAASLDGGETFSASVPVTDNANAYPLTTPWDLQGSGTRGFPREDEKLVSARISIQRFFMGGGDTSGLAVDADGTFHPMWNDNHTGIPQLWSASLKVNGPVIKNGASNLAALEDISPAVTMELSNPILDQATGTLSVSAQLMNKSKDTVETPLKVRVVSLESEFGVPEITNAGNGEKGTGAVWDFSSEVAAGKLESMGLSAPKTLTFRLSDLRPLRSGKDFRSDVVHLHARVYGKLRKEEGGH